MTIGFELSTLSETKDIDGLKSAHIFSSERFSYVVVNVILFSFTVYVKLRENETKSTALVPLNYQPPVITDKARITANHRMNIVKAALEHRKKYDTQKQADTKSSSRRAMPEMPRPPRRWVL